MLQKLACLVEHRWVWNWITWHYNYYNNGSSFWDIISNEKRLNAYKSNAVMKMWVWVDNDIEYKERRNTKNRIKKMRETRHSDTKTNEERSSSYSKLIAIQIVKKSNDRKYHKEWRSDSQSLDREGKLGNNNQWCWLLWIFFFFFLNKGNGNTFCLLSLIRSIPLRLRLKKIITQNKNKHF